MKDERSKIAVMPKTHVDDNGAQFGFKNIPFGVVSTQDDPVPKAATRLFRHVFRLPDLISRNLMGNLDEETRSALLKVCSNGYRLAYAD